MPARGVPVFAPLARMRAGPHPHQPNRERRRPAPATPVPARPGLMRAGPLHDKPNGARRQPPSDHLEILNVDRRLVAAIAGTEMGATEMVILVVVHPDHNPVER